MSEVLGSQVIDLALSLEDEKARYRAAAFIGIVMTGQNIELAPIDETETLLDKLEPASQGDKEAFLAIASNIHTEFVEWKHKSKNIVQSRSIIRNDGQAVQHGHLWRDIQANTIKRRIDSAVLQARAPIEIINNFRIEHEIKDGRLLDYWFVVSSAVPVYLTPDQAEQEGFFADSMSLAIQATTQDKYGLLTESAFVAGSDGRNEQRFDVATLKKVYSYLGVDINASDSEDILARPLLIHKSVMPNGVSDFVKLYDFFASGNRFFGVQGNIGNYDTFANKCFERERDFDEIAEVITKQLIEERSTFNEPLDLVKRMTKLVKHHLVDRATTDTSINPAIFGREAAVFLEQARAYLKDGNEAGAKQAKLDAHKTAKGGACGTFSGAEDIPKDGEDWSGGSTEKFTKCKSCKSFVYEVGGCKICKSCVQKPWIREKAWSDYQKEQNRKKHLKRQKIGANALKASNEQFVTVA